MIEVLIAIFLMAWAGLLVVAAAGHDREIARRNKRTRK
jgi:Tfp pilus assembly protein PilV